MVALLQPVWFSDADDVLGVVASAPAWQRDAACAEDHPEADWFPARGQVARLRAAQAVCRACLVQGECLAFALENEIGEGVWGGAAPAERVELRKLGVSADDLRPDPDDDPVLEVF